MRRTTTATVAGRIVLPVSQRMRRRSCRHIADTAPPLPEAGLRRRRRSFRTKRPAECFGLYNVQRRTLTLSAVFENTYFLRFSRRFQKRDFVRFFLK